MDEQASVLSERAEENFRSIWEYSVAEFGEAQAERYVERLFDAFGMLEAHPRMGRTVPEGPPGTRVFPVGSHYVFFRPAGETIIVLAILHQASDAVEHIREELD